MSSLFITLLSTVISKLASITVPSLLVHCTGITLSLYIPTTSPYMISCATPPKPYSQSRISLLLGPAPWFGKSAQFFQYTKDSLYQ